jgi:hypothetical protein
MPTQNGKTWSASAASGSEPSEPSSAGQKAPPQQSPPGGADATPAEARTPAAESGVDPDHQPAMNAPPPPLARDPAAGKLGRALQAQLGRQLRTIFADVAEEPVPERFVKLLEELEAREKRR